MSNEGTGLQKIKGVANGKGAAQIGLGGTTAAAVSYLMVVLLNPLQDRVDDLVKTQTNLQIRNGQLEGKIDNLKFRIERLENQRRTFDFRADEIREARSKSGCAPKKKYSGRTRKVSSFKQSYLEL